MAKILGVSFETIDTRVVAASLARLKGDVSCTPLILAGDPYQVNYTSAAQDLERIRNQYQIPILTILECLRERHQEIEKTDVLKSRLFEWTQKNNIDTSTADLFLSDHIFSHYERSPYYNTMSEQEKLSIFLSFCEYTTDIFEDHSPSLVFCIGKNYIIKNIVAAICKSKNIQFVVLDHTRVGDRYAFFQSFLPEKGEFEVCHEYLLKAKDYIDKAFVRLNNNATSDGLYISATKGQVGMLKENNKSILSALSSELRLIVKYTARFLKEFRNRGVATILNPYTSNPFYVLSYYYLNSIRRFRYACFGLPYTGKIPSGCHFFYFPLHLRPESSILTLGRGLDDEIALEYLVRKLPKEVYLVVKENPMMVGDRRKKFYRWVSRQTSVILVDPLMSSYDLIVNSKGTIGISGTALLEAAILGKPTHAFGHPEFRDFLTSFGYDDLDTFFNIALSDNKMLNNEVYKYIGWALENGIELKIDRSLLKNDQAMRETAKLIASSLKKFV